MRILLIADEWNARRERDLIHRVEIGLLADADRVIYAHPRRLPKNHVGPFVSAIPFQARGSRFTTSIRAERLTADLRSTYTDFDDDRRLDIVHAFGHWSWPVARAIARAQSAALCIELNSTRAIHRAASLLRRIKRGGRPVDVVFTVGDLALLNLANAQLKGARIHLTSWGVHQNAKATTPRPDTPPSVVITADPWHARSVRPVLAALADRGDDTMVFLDEETARADPAVWSDARASGLLPRLDVVALPEANRQLALDADALIIAGRAALLRSITLDAFAARTPVVALEDPAIDLLTPPAFTITPQDDTPAAWGRALDIALDRDNEKRTEALDRAQRFADEDRSPSSHIQSVLRVYTGLLERPSIPFTPAAAHAN